MGLSGLEFRPINTENWPDYESLMESRGAPHNCWCTAWLKVDKGADKSAKKAVMKKRIEAGIPVGLLAYIDNAAIGWCAVAPRETYRSLGGDESKQNVWSVVCFFMKRAYRGQGLSSLFLDQAIEFATQQGATYIEAYPVDKDSPSYRFMGFKPTFEKAKFEFIKNAGARRHVMIKKLSEF